MKIALRWSNVPVSLVLGTLLLPALPPSRLRAQSPDTTWDVTKPRGKTREIDFTTREGTWMSLDISPGGQWIVFDLLGQVYRVSAAGGEAECLTQDSGIAINIEPRFSPDGKSIAFISDRKGQNNLWVMDADGRNPKPVYLDPAVRIEYPVWSADGQYIIAGKRQGLISRSIAMFYRGGGKGTELIKSEPGKAVGKAAVSTDGRYVYYDIFTGRFTGEYGKDDLLSGTQQLRRFDLETGVESAITAGVSRQQDRATSGSAYAPEPSPDGHWLAFIRRVPDGTFSWKGHKFGPRSALWLRNLETGSERLLMDPVELDMAEEGIPVDGNYPGYRWVGDGKSILITQGGKIRRVDVASGQVSTISFSARVHRTISEQAWGSFKLSDGPVEVRFTRWQSVSPDGRQALFQAVGRVWIMDLPNGPPRRVTPAGFTPLEFGPAWSPDGRWVAFTSWDDANQGQVYKVASSGGAPVQLTRSAGEYLNPAWSPDGQSLVVVRGPGATSRASTLDRNPYWELIRLAAGGGDGDLLVQIARTNGFAQVARPSFGPGERVFFTELRSVPNPTTPFLNVTVGELSSVKLDGSDRQVHLRAEYADDITPSPDGKWVAFAQAGDVFVAPFAYRRNGGSIPQVSKNGGATTVTRLTKEGGLFPRWRNNSTIDFGSGNHLYSHLVATGKTDTLVAHLTVPRELPPGSVALTGARIIPLDHQKVIEHGTVVVKAGRITCVGSCSIAGVDRVINASGKTIIPGWIDMHAHHHREHEGITPAHNFETAVYLAYGVTTTLDPAAWSPEAFSSAELIEAGPMIGPRVFATAENITSGDGTGTNDLVSLDAALREGARRKAWGAVSLKQYLQPTRYQRQWVAEAGRQLGLMVTAEGSIDLPHKLSMAMDGHSGFEHATALLPMYGDVTTFLGKAHTVNSYTGLVAGPGPWNEEYFWQESDIWKDPKAQRWIPWRELIPHSRSRIMRPATDYPLGMMSQVIADVIAAGGFGAMGSHGQEHGLGSHWDVWIAALGMGNMGALEMASMHGAIFLGMEKDLGSIAPGKLADLMVLNSNPLENIRNTVDLKYVMKQGIVYDATSLDELWPRARKFGDYYWYVPELYRADDKPIDVWDRK